MWGLLDTVVGFSARDQSKRPEGARYAEPEALLLVTTPHVLGGLG